MNAQLAATIARTRQAVLARQGGAVVDPFSGAGTMPPTRKPTQPPAPLVHPGPPRRPPPPSRPACASLEALTAHHALAPGPRRLHQLLHQLGQDTVAARAYRVTPSQVTLHSAQELVAAALGVHVVTIWRWSRPLIEAGLIAARPHYTTSKGSTRADGTLYCVALQVGHVAHLAYDDLAHEWRDLDADRKAGRTAWKVLQGSDRRDIAEWKILLQRWAVTPGHTDSPLSSSDPCTAPRTLQDVAYTLPLVIEAHPDKRAALVGILASQIAHLLHDQHSRRWYCSLIWTAYRAELEGRPGLQLLAAQLLRLASDLREHPGLRTPGSWLAARLR